MSGEWGRWGGNTPKGRGPTGPHMARNVLGPSKSSPAHWASMIASHYCLVNWLKDVEDSERVNDGGV